MSGATTDVEGYLDRLGLTERPPATLEGLRAVHRAHVARITYDNFSIMLGRPDPVDPVAAVGRDGIVVTSRDHSGAASDAAHRMLSLGEESPFRRLVVAQRIVGPEQRTVRGLTHQVLTPTGREQRDLTSYDDWRGALVDDLLLPVADVSGEEWRATWDRSLAAHPAWEQAGRP